MTNTNKDKKNSRNKYKIEDPDLDDKMKKKAPGKKQEPKRK